MAILGTITTGSDLLAVSDRDRILQAMADCCAERGYSATRIDDVLQRAAVSREAFESHFSTKEDCAVATFNKLVSETMLTISTLSPAAASPAERRAREVGALLGLMAARPSFARLGLIDARQGGTKQMHRSYESAMNVLALMMERSRIGQGSGSLGPNSGRAALGGMEAVVRRELAAGRAERLPSLLRSFVYAALVPVVGQGEALRQASEAARRADEEE